MIKTFTIMNRPLDNFEQVTNKLHQIYLKKNSDYGSSFDELYDAFGIQSSVIRLTDKLNRLKNLTKKDTLCCCTEESIDDTLMDLANYAILTLMKRRYDAQKKHEEHWEKTYTAPTVDLPIVNQYQSISSTNDTSKNSGTLYALNEVNNTVNRSTASNSPRQDDLNTFLKSQKDLMLKVDKEYGKPKCNDDDETYDEFDTALYENLREDNTTNSESNNEKPYEKPEAFDIPVQRPKKSKKA